MLGKVAITAGAEGGQVTILTSLSQVPSIPPPSPSAFPGVGHIEVVRINHIKAKSTIGKIPLKRRRATTFFSDDIDIDMKLSLLLAWERRN